MVKDTVRKLSIQFDEAILTLNELRLISGCEVFPPDVPDPTVRHSVAYMTAKRLINNRQSRGDYIGNDEIFGEPAWDILLDLYVHQAQNDEVSVKSATIGSGAPATTALRWLSELQKRGLICSADDQTDARRRFIRLTAEGYESMTRYLEYVSR